MMAIGQLYPGEEVLNRVRSVSPFTFHFRWMNSLCGDDLAGSCWFVGCLVGLVFVLVLFGCWYFLWCWFLLVWFDASSSSFCLYKSYMNC